MPGQGPKLVVTDKAIFEFDEESREMVLSSLHPGITLEETLEQVGWPVKVKADLETTRPPTGEELRIIREKLDPDGIYTSK